MADSTNYAFNNPSSDSNSPNNTPQQLRPFFLYPIFPIIQYHPFYPLFPPHFGYFPHPQPPNYSHSDPQPDSEPHPVAPDPRRSGLRGFTGGRRGHRNFHGRASVKKVWKPKQSPNSNCTTLMIKNIPNHFSRSSLIELLGIHCRDQKNESPPSEFDFLYLPFDFRKGRNLGYAFVNFTTTEGAARLYRCWENKGWDESAKIRKITRAKLQGKQKCEKYFQSSRFPCHTDDYLPVLFSPARDGANDGNSMMTTIGTLMIYR